MLWSTNLFRNCICCLETFKHSKSLEYHRLNFQKNRKKAETCHTAAWGKTACVCGSLQLFFLSFFTLFSLLPLRYILHQHLEFYGVFFFKYFTSYYCLLHNLILLSGSHNKALERKQTEATEQTFFILPISPCFKAKDLGQAEWMLE